MDTWLVNVSILEEQSSQKATLPAKEASTINVYRANIHTCTSTCTKTHTQTEITCVKSYCSTMFGFGSNSTYTTVLLHKALEDPIL